VSAYHKNALPTGYTLAEYRIESVLGHGGFGITYLARDTSLGALVAIKEFLPHDIAARDDKTGAILPNPTRGAVRDYQWGLKNFVKEARALARFKHPHIVRVLRFLEANGTAYTVMEYEKGQTLAEYLKKHGPALDEATLLRVFIPILNGLHAVHEAHMLHLDIKPANIYLREDGSPMLIDFGSARQAITATTQAQRIALTRGYAPMEQYPEKGKPGPWTDIYGIGATMYRCVMGRNPIESLERYRAVLDYKVDPLTPATKTKAGNYRENILECIDWAMQIYAKDRPQSAREFQDALMGARRKSIPAVSIDVPPSRGNAASSMRAPSLPLPLGWIIGLLLLIGAAGAIYYMWPELQKKWRSIEREIAKQERSTRNVPAKPEAPRKPVEAAKARKPAVDPEARRTSSPPQKLGGGEASRSTVPNVLARTFSGHKDWVQSVSFSPDGRWLVSGSNDKSIKVWDLKKSALVGTLYGHGYAINSVAVSPDGKWIASGGVDGTVRLWVLATGRQQGALRGHGYAIYSVAFSPDGARLVAGGKDRTVFLWDLKSGESLHALDGHDGDIFAVVISPDGRLIASAGADQKVMVWDAQGGRRFELAGHRDSILSLAFSPDGKYLASGGAAHTIRIWDMETGSHVRTLNVVDAPVLSLVFGRDGGWLAAGLADNSIRVIDSGNGQILQTLRGHEDLVQSVALSPAGDLLASGSRDRSVKLWRALP